MRRYAVTLLAIIAACATPATADALPASTAAGDIPIAEAHWGGPPPQCSSVTFTTEIEPGTGGSATLPPPNWYGPCTMRVDEVGIVDEFGVIITPEYACLVAVHEEGHLHGFGHVTDPNSIMYGGPVLTSAEVPECQEPTVATAPEFTEAEIVAHEQAEIEAENAAIERALDREEWRAARSRCRRHPSRKCWRHVRKLHRVAFVPST